MIGKLIAPAALAAGAFALSTPAAHAQAAPQKLERCFVGQRVLTPGGLPATVTAAQGAGCTIKTDAGNTFVDGTFGAFMLRPLPGAPTTARGVNTTAPTPPASVGGSLPPGEYACYGSGGRVLIGLGFKVQAGGRYTDLDGKSPGRVAVNGTNVVFTGGHLGGENGRNLKGKSFVLGTLATCEPW